MQANFVIGSADHRKKKISLRLQHCVGGVSLLANGETVLRIYDDGHIRTDSNFVENGYGCAGIINIEKLPEE